MPNATLLIIAQYAVANLILLEIHLPDATSYHVRIYQRMYPLSYYNNNNNITAPVEVIVQQPTNPCIPSPCGPNSECRNIGESPACSCKLGYIGSPPNCRPECVINSDCQSHLACVLEKCREPCAGSCGVDANCKVINHTPICNCPEGFTGDPFTRCAPKPPRKLTLDQGSKTNAKHFYPFNITIEPVEKNPCSPSPCGPNALCNNGICTCIVDYQGDPYIGCKPECILSSECPRDKACIRLKCVDPCPGTCGQNAECAVINHIPTCTCISGYSGNAFILCTKIPGTKSQTLTYNKFYIKSRFSACTYQSLRTNTLRP